MKIRVFMLDDTITAITPTPQIELAASAGNQHGVKFGGSSPALNRPGLKYCDLDSVDDLQLDIEQVNDHQLRERISAVLRERTDISFVSL